MTEGAGPAGRGGRDTGASSSEELVADHSMVAARKQLGLESGGASHPYGPPPGSDVC